MCYSKLKRKSLQDILKENQEAQVAYKLSLIRYHASAGYKDNEQRNLQLTHDKSAKFPPNSTENKSLKVFCKFNTSLFDKGGLAESAFVILATSLLALLLLLQRLQVGTLQSCSDLNFFEQYFYKIPCVPTHDRGILNVLKLLFWCPFHVFWDFIHPRPQPVFLGNLYGSSHNLILDLIRQWSR
jgi:hypothetical protein